MPTIITERQLAQQLIGSTAATTLYQPRSDQMRTKIVTLIVCNTTAASKTYSVWINQNGTESGDRFALIKGMTISANASDQRIYPGDSGLILIGSTASIIVQASVANALTFTMYGLEVEQN